MKERAEILERAKKLGRAERIRTAKKAKGQKQKSKPEVSLERAKRIEIIRKQKQHELPKFGDFRCKECGNRWKSVYCWSGENKKCREKNAGGTECETPCEPFNLKELEFGLATGSGVHDCSRCSKCIASIQKEGKDCRGRMVFKWTERMKPPPPPPPPPRP